MDLLEELELAELHLVRDPASGLRAAVAIHDRTLGPPRGGTRLARYPTLEAAAREAGRLARAMTYKFAVHDQPFGGGKAVIVQDDAGAADRGLLERRLLAYGAFVERLGDFGTGPDMGIGAAEVAVIQRATARAVGHRSHAAASRATAAGVRAALALGLAAADGAADLARPAELAGRRVVIVGVGAVGGALARDLAARGATLVLADADPARAEALAAELGAAALSPEAAVALEADALAPCAGGGLLDEATTARLRCRVVAGGANDLLAPPEAERAATLAARGVVYVPDFVANGGAAVALVGCGEEAREDDVSRAEARVAATTRAVLERARERGESPYAAACSLARERLARLAAGEAAS